MISLCFLGFTNADNQSAKYIDFLILRN